LGGAHDLEGAPSTGSSRLILADRAARPANVAAALRQPMWDRLIFNGNFVARDLLSQEPGYVCVRWGNHNGD
jgi:hypothetical protein